jgi:hypothetical protein
VRRSDSPFSSVGDRRSPPTDRQRAGAWENLPHRQAESCARSKGVRTLDGGRELLFPTLDSRRPTKERRPLPVSPSPPNDG